MKSPTFSWNLHFLMKSVLFFEILTFAWNLDLFLEISTFTHNLIFFLQIFIFALLPHSTPVDPQTQNPLYSTHVDPQTPNSLYSALAEREHKTRARVKISGSWKNLCFKRDLSKTINWTQERQYPKGNALTLGGKLFPCQLNSRILSREHFSDKKIPKVLEHDWCNFPLNPNYSKSRVSELRLRDLFFGIPLLQIDLTLPPASPPISPGLQRHLLSPSRGRARDGGAFFMRGWVLPSHRRALDGILGEENIERARRLDRSTQQSRNQIYNSNRTSGHLKVVILIRPLDTSDPRTHQSRNQSYNSNRTSGHLKIEF